MIVNITDKTYQKHLTEEADLWDKTARDELEINVPDYQIYYTNTLPYKIYRNPYVDKMLSLIKSRDRVLELGAYNGWFSLEMARKGAYIDAHDIAGEALDLGKRYYEQVKKKEHFTGTISYHVTDLNAATFPKKTYDVIVIRNVLHHIINLEKLFHELHQSLKPHGILLTEDALPCGRKEALLTGFLLMILPTDIPYTQKIKRVFRKKDILKRTQGLVDAKDASPFESISGAESIDYIKQYFIIKNYTTYAAFVGTLTPRLKLPVFLIVPMLTALKYLDTFLTKIHILQGTIYFLIAEKK